MEDPMKREAHADIRQGARFMRDMFVSLVQEGFSEQQALRIVAEMLRPRAEGQ